MWEFMTGRRPFWDRNHDIELIIDISDGLRPPIVTNAPESYIELMKECWNSDHNKLLIYMKELIKCSRENIEHKQNYTLIRYWTCKS
jgi:hypothetical protein